MTAINPGAVLAEYFATEIDQTPAGPHLDRNGQPYDTWRVAGTSIFEPYPERFRRAA